MPAVISGVLAAGGFVRVGCARGVDACVREIVPSSRLAVVSVSDYSHLPIRVALTTRTHSVVSGSQCLLAFPLSSGVLGKGTAIAVSTALELSLPVWVAGPVCPVGFGWKSLELFGTAGWLCMPLQVGLF